MTSPPRPHPPQRLNARPSSSTSTSPSTCGPFTRRARARSSTPSSRRPGRPRLARRDSLAAPCATRSSSRPRPSACSGLGGARARRKRVRARARCVPSLLLILLLAPLPLPSPFPPFPRRLARSHRLGTSARVDPECSADVPPSSPVPAADPFLDHLEPDFASAILPADLPHDRRPRRNVEQVPHRPPAPAAPDARRQRPPAGRAVRARSPSRRSAQFGARLAPPERPAGARSSCLAPRHGPRSSSPGCTCAFERARTRRAVQGAARQDPPRPQKGPLRSPATLAVARPRAGQGEPAPRGLEAGQGKPGASAFLPFLSQDGLVLILLTLCAALQPRHRPRLHQGRPARRQPLAPSLPSPGQPPARPRARPPRLAPLLPLERPPHRPNPSRPLCARVRRRARGETRRAGARHAPSRRVERRPRDSADDER